jgi:hypothetical protein
VTAIAGFVAFCAITPARAAAQSSTLKVLGSDSMPIAFAWVSIQGADARVTDQQGVVNLGAGHHKTMTVNVRRIGYEPWFGKVELPDTAATMTVVLTRATQQLAGVTVSARSVSRALELAGFYDRWLEKQKGALSATFIGPEEIEKRHPSRTTDLLAGLNGVSFTHMPDGSLVARGNGGQCFMTVLLDGQRLCPDKGCNSMNEQNAGFPIGPPQPVRSQSDLAAAQALPPTVDINRYIDASAVAAIEVYARGGNMPISLQADDSACGVIAIWTGARK